MLDKLEFIEKKYEDLSRAIADPDVIARQNEWRQMIKEHADLEDIVIKYREYKKIEQDIEVAKEMLNEKLDDEFREMLEDELAQLNQQHEEVIRSLEYCLYPKILMMRRTLSWKYGQAQGKEAALFGADLSGCLRYAGARVEDGDYER